MIKALSVAIAAVFAAASFSVLAASHMGAQKDGKKMEVKAKGDGKAVTTKDGKKVETKADKKK